MLGGTGVISAVAANYRQFWVSCRADRVSGYKSTATMQRKEAQFDWYRFWTYLRPHLLKLIGAICVRGVCENARAVYHILVYLFSVCVSVYYRPR